MGQTGRIGDVHEDSREVVGEDDVVSDESMKANDHDLRSYRKPGSWDFLWHFDDERHDRPAIGNETI